MPRKPAPGGRKIGKITEEAMKEALEEVLRGKSIRLASKENNIPFTTLYRYNVKMKARGCIENIKLEPNYNEQKKMKTFQYTMRIPTGVRRMRLKLHHSRMSS